MSVFSIPVHADNVLLSQELLTKLGYTPGQIDGSYGSKTKFSLENFYERVLKGALKGWKPIAITFGTFLLLFAAFAGFGASVESQRTKIEFFPDNKPNQIIVYIEYPQGTDIEKTNAITKEIEKRVFKALDNDQ